ncbi:hypothetical protein GPU89_06525 [Burkholderia cepacia]|nr:hypothetical protein [Burkholderia cepacia]
MHTSGLILGASVLLAAGASPAQDQDIAACRQSAWLRWLLDRTPNCASAALAMPMIKRPDPSM